MRFLFLLIFTGLLTACSTVPEYLVPVAEDEKSFYCTGSSTYRHDVSANSKVTNVFDGKPLFNSSYLTLISKDNKYICEYWQWNGVEYKYEFAIEGNSTNNSYNCVKKEESKFASKIQEVSLNRQDGFISERNFQLHCDANQWCLLVSSTFAGSCSKSSYRPSYHGINKKL